ncbi:MAG TPA: hypothetical protein VI953_02675 [Candidatus Paceibacterota bacterium]
MAKQPVYSRKSIHYRAWRNTYWLNAISCFDPTHQKKEGRCTPDAHLPSRIVGRCRYWERIIWGNLVMLLFAALVLMALVVFAALFVVVTASYLSVYVLWSAFALAIGAGRPSKWPALSGKSSLTLSPYVPFTWRTRLAMWGIYAVGALYWMRASLPGVVTTAGAHREGIFTVILTTAGAAGLAILIYSIVSRVKVLRGRAKASTWLSQVGECFSEFWAYLKDKWHNEVCPGITFVD